MQEVHPLVTKEVADRSDWKKRVEECDGLLSSAFFKLSKDAKAADDEPLAQFYDLVAQVMSMYYKEDKSSSPFGPMMSGFGGGRTAITEDFSDANLEIFEYLLGKTDVHRFNARLADVLWLRKRKIEFAEAAIAAYLREVKQRLHYSQEGWHDGYTALKRGLQLWRSIGGPENFGKEYRATVEATILEIAAEPKDYCRVMLLNTFTESGLMQDHKGWTDKARAWGDDALKAKDFRKSRDYMKAIEKIARTMKDDALVVQSREDELKASIAEAEHFKEMGAAAMIVAHRYGEAIEIARRIGGKRKLIDELHAAKNAAQEATLKEMKSVEVKFDPGPSIKAALKSIEGLSAEETIRAIGLMAVPPKKASLRASAEEASKKFVFQAHVPATIVGAKGRSVAKKGSAIEPGTPEWENGIEGAMMHDLSLHQSYCAATVIEACRRELDRRYKSDAAHLAQFVEFNAFVPPGREALFEKGLLAGMRGDWTECLHILIPQIENSVRTVLERAGEIVTHLDEDQVQNELPLHVLLKKPTTEKIFGEDLVFSMRVLLTEKMGKNLRNSLAHGLLDSRQFNLETSNFLWATTILLCHYGKVVAERDLRQAGAEPTEAAEGAAAESPAPAQSEAVRSSDPTVNGETGSQ
ncbi:DUF4209 domain-containing protein [Elusimicrobiota bacterium]